MSKATNDPLSAKAGESVQDHKARVMEAARAHADSQTVAARATTTRPPDGFPKPPGTPSNIPDFMQGMGVVSPQDPPVAAAPNGPAKTQTAAPGTSLPNDLEPEWQRVAREKGWKTVQDVMNSYSNIEREFHSRNQRPPLPPAPAYMPPPPAPPPQTWTTPYPQMPPAYATPAPINVVRQLAGKYRIPDEDAERLIPLMAEVSQAAAENALLMERARTTPVIQDLSRKVARNEEMSEVANDPAMRVPRVQFEVNKLLSENPTVFAHEAQPLRWALDRALRNIAQESLRADQNVYDAPGYPQTPPVTAGSPANTRGSQPPAGAPSVDLTGSYFKLKTAQEKLEFLRQMGVAPE